MPGLPSGSALTWGWCPTTRRRIMEAMRRTFQLVALAAVALAVAPAASAATTLPACGVGTPTNCVVSVARNGVPVTYPTLPADPYQVSALRYTDTGTHHFNFTISRTSGGPFTLDLTDTWKVVLNTGSTYPEETFARGRTVSISRGGAAAGGYTVAFTMQPVRMAITDDACGHMGTCGGPTSVAPHLFTGYLDGWTNDLHYVSDPDDAAAMRGFDLATNADWVSTPLQLDFATHAIVLDVANRHFEPDATTPFVGSAEFRIPFAMLTRLYLVDDPATLTSSAFTVTAAGGVAPLTVVSVGSSSVHVTMTNIGFSKRHLVIRGDTRPLAPRNLRAAHATPTSALIRFDPSRRRGSKVRGYQAVCRSGALTVRGSARRSPIKVTGLVPSRRYTCSVRAKSHAGLGRIGRVTIRPARG